MPTESATIRFRSPEQAELAGCAPCPALPEEPPAMPVPFGVMGAIRPDDAPPLDYRLRQPLPAAGWLEIEVEPKRAYLNGEAQEPELVPLLDVPGFGRLIVGLPEDRVAVLLIWQIPTQANDSLPRIMVNIPELPGPERYHFLLTWDASRGLCTLHMNGVCTADADVPGKPWAVAEADLVRLRPACFTYHRLAFGSGYVPAGQARSHCPEALRDRRSVLLGKRVVASPIDLRQRRGELLYSCPLASEADFEDWLVDVGAISFVDGWLRVASEDPTATDPNLGHTTIWCPFHAPDSFVAEWDTRVVEDGLIIVFFACHGIDGESPFDPRLPRRRGEFIYYIKDRLLSYHTSYYTRARGITNLRKNNRFWLISTGQAGIPGGSREEHRLRLVKDAGHIQVLVDDRLVLDCLDDHVKRYGPRHQDGWIGFRQMRPGTADYRNLRLWSLHPSS